MEFQALGKTIARNSLLNIATAMLIVALNLIFVPLMLRAFGVELFGVLSVSWMVLANLGWLDFGFSRASARYVSQELAAGKPDQAAMWSWTALVTQGSIGACGGIALWALAPQLVAHLHVDSARAGLASLTLQLFALSVPIDLAARSMNGVLRAGQRFEWINSVNVLSTLATFAAYGLGLWRNHSFSVVIYGLLLVRIMVFISLYLGARRVLPGLGRLPLFAAMRSEYRSRVLAMVRFGCWTTLAASMGPFLLYFDRWLISAILGVALLPFYTVPFNLLARLEIFPSSLSSTLFPAFSAMSAGTGREKIEAYFVRSHRYVLIAVAPILFVLYTWSYEILRLWIDPAFAAQSAGPLRILALGFGMALMAPLSGALLDALGRPDVLAKLYVVEAPLNVAAVWLLTTRFGIAGASFSYLLRSVVETSVLWFVVYRIALSSGTRMFRAAMARPVALISGMAVVGFLIRDARIDSPTQITVTLATLLAYGLAILLFALNPEERAFLARTLSGWRLQVVDGAQDFAGQNSPQ